MNTYLITDTHFGHEKLYREHGRPINFEALLIDSLHNLRGDLLVHLGDFCIGNDADWHHEFMSNTSNFKKKILVLGNHDHKSMSWYYDHGWDFVCYDFHAKFFGKKVLFSHFPRAKVVGVDYNIHGHLHGNNHRQEDKDAVQYDSEFHKDMAPELHNYKPVNLKVILN